MRPLLLLAAAALVSSCAYDQTAHNENRRQQLLAVYPVGKTTVRNVRERWSHDPQIDLKRPSGGWQTLNDPWVRRYATTAEKRIGRHISRTERYFGADGFFSLCYCWFYYDSRDRLIDAEWQWSSD